MSNYSDTSVSSLSWTISTFVTDLSLYAALNGASAAYTSEVRTAVRYC
jgi:hypothetical protein